MKKSAIVFVFLFSFLLVGCGSKPMTDADLAKKYGMSIEEFQEQKEAAARMGMDVETHLKGSSAGGGSHKMDDGRMMNDMDM